MKKEEDTIKHIGKLYEKQRELRFSLKILQMHLNAN